MKFNKPTALCLLIALGMQTNATAMTNSTIKNDYFNQYNSNAGGENLRSEADDGQFILGDPSVFRNEDGSFVLSSDEWSMIQLFANTAGSLPTTESMMRLQFKMNDNQSFDGVYKELLDSYQQIHDNAGAWLNPNGYRDQMVSLASSLSVYSKNVVDTSGFLQVYTEALEKAAQEGVITGDYTDFENYKELLIVVVSEMRENALKLQNESTELENKLTDFINLLAEQKNHLNVVEDANSYILYDDGSVIQEKIKRLIVEKDQLNKDYLRWVKASATTPTYVWAWPWGTIASVVVAGVGTAESLKLKARLEAKKAELEEATKELNHAQSVYQSWKLATTNIDNISEKLSDALTSLGKLRGGWANISANLESVIPTIDDMTAENSLNNSNKWMASILAKQSVLNLQSTWKQIDEDAKKWVANAYITEATFKVN